MFSATTCQPQVAFAVNHLSTIVNSIRNGSNSVIIPKSRRAQRHRAVSSQQEAGVTEGSHNEKSASNESALKQLDAESCLAVLLTEYNINKLLPYFIVPEANHWKTSYISATTFFENKNGFKEHMLTQNGFCSILKPEVVSLLSHKLSPGFKEHMLTQNGFCSILRPEVVSLLSHKLSPALTIDQRRMYAKETRKTGIGQPSFLLDRPKSSTEIVHKLSVNQGDDVKERINIAYLEGLKKRATLNTDKATQFKLRFFKYLFIVISVYLLIILSDLSLGPGRSALSIAAPVNFEVNPEEVTVKFSDVKGCDEAKEELADIVEFLKNGEKFQAIGAKLPKGVLLVGSPGVGKTLLAKAVAGEAGVHYFQASGSEFDEMFVGSGSRKIRQLFASAKQRAPSVIFIDEIDSAGTKRTSSQMHPYANQTVNQLLSEMDGFTGSSGVIVIGATNKKENLDSALLRPGRFDIEVNVLPPDANGREEIFRLYLSKMNYSKDIDFKELGLITRGMTGADINSIVNQAAIRAVLQDKLEVTKADLDFARDKVIMGPAWKNKKIDEETNWNTAYHEAGHTLVAYYTKEAKPLHKVTILPRGQSLGHTAFTEDKEMYGQTKLQMLALIDVAMGGRVGEELKYGTEKVTSGASGDFQSATRIATAMVKKFGMSEKIGPRVHSDSAMDGGVSFIQVNEISPSMQQVIDSEIDRILNESYARAKEILTRHKREHELLAEGLMKYETLDKKEIKEVIEGRQLKRVLPSKNKDDKKDSPKIKDKTSKIDTPVLGPDGRNNL